MTRKRFPHYWSFLRGKSNGDRWIPPTADQLCKAFTFSLTLARPICYTNIHLPVICEIDHMTSQSWWKLDVLVWLIVGTMICKNSQTDFPSWYILCHSQTDFPSWYILCRYVVYTYTYPQIPLRTPLRKGRVYGWHCFTHRGHQFAAHIFKCMTMYEPLLTQVYKVIGHY